METQNYLIINPISECGRLYNDLIRRQNLPKKERKQQEDNQSQFESITENGEGIDLLA